MLTLLLTLFLSIRTLGSWDSAGRTGVQHGYDQDNVVFNKEIHDTNLDSTRFLLVGATIKGLVVTHLDHFLLFRLAM
jgi:hypothetical protein